MYADYSVIKIFIFCGTILQNRRRALESFLRARAMFRKRRLRPPAPAPPPPPRSSSVYYCYLYYIRLIIILYVFFFRRQTAKIVRAHHRARQYNIAGKLLLSQAVKTQTSGRDPFPPPNPIIIAVRARPPLFIVVRRQY